MAEKLPERPQIDLDNEAVQRAQARREAMTRSAGGRNVLIGIGLALVAMVAFGIFYRATTPPPSPSVPASATTGGSSAPVSPASRASEPATTPPPPPSGHGADVPYVDPRTGPQSGYDLDPAEASKQAGMLNAATLSDEETRIVAERVFMKSGIRLLQFTDATRAGAVTCAAAPAEDVERYASLVENELAVYPQRFLSESGVAFVALCRDLGEGGRRRSAMGIIASRVVVLDTAQYRDEGYFRASFHRALFRVIDGFAHPFADAEWTALNPSGVTYARSDKYVSDPVSDIGSGGAGFVTETARESPEDDKAETFRAMLLDSRATERLAASDAVVGRKVELLKRRLLARSNTFDSAFWAAAH